MNVLIYLVTGGIGIFLSYVGIVFAALGGLQFAYLIGGLLLAAHIGAFIFVYRKAKQGRGPEVAVVLVLPLPLVMGATYLFTVGQEALRFLEPEPAEFTAACQTAGAKFYKLPALPVHSIAYDWDSKTAPPYSSFSLGFGSRVSALGGIDPRYPRCPDGITFVEQRHSDQEGLPPGSPVHMFVFPAMGLSTASPT